MRAFKVLTDALDSPVAMLGTIGLTGYWIYTDPKTWYDALLAGGAMLLAQSIYKTGEPRDRAMHRKIDSIIEGTDADDNLVHCEEY